MRPFALLGLWMTVGVASAGYLSLNVTQATQCGTSTVQWWGDDGPYHLLLTPTTFKEHGYNVWIPTIDASLNKYEIAIKQPAGLQFLVTMWGASGIEMAGTTDVLTVGPSTATSGNTSSCFMSDADILSLYTFSFNMSDPTNGYPPQCGNLSMSWPTSLESNISGGGSISNTRRKRAETTSQLDVESSAADVVETSQRIDDDVEFNQLDSSSSSDKHSGNTTNPPTIFGIIPLGNSFSIPITYSNSSKLAPKLPSSSISNTPTTWTAQGITHLNWTIDMARGTRFILVAGIGSQEQWASGGSSSMLTVGQGSSNCAFNDPDGAPSVTASSTSTATAISDNGQPKQSGTSPITKTIIACVLSILVTLVLVTILFYLRRLRNRRRATAAATASSNDIYQGGSIKRKLTRARAMAYDPRAGLEGDSATQLDLIASTSREEEGVVPRRELAPIITRLRDEEDDLPRSGSRGNDPFMDSPVGSTPLSSSGRVLLPPSRSTTFDSTLETASGSRQRVSGMTRHASQDALLGYTGYNNDVPPPLPARRDGGSGVLRLHDASGSRDYEDEELGVGNEDIPDLKRETLAYLGEQPLPSDANGEERERRRAATATPSAGRRRRPGGEQREMEYMVHRDAGRVRTDNAGTGGRVLELPPRYEELDWDGEEAEDRARQTR